jgi:hypothetical protein
MEGTERQPQNANTADEGGAEVANDRVDRERVIRETREAGMRAEGGGSADEAEIQEEARNAE